MDKGFKVMLVNKEVSEEIKERYSEGSYTYVDYGEDGRAIDSLISDEKKGILRISDERVNILVEYCLHQIGSFEPINNRVDFLKWKTLEES